MSLPLKVECGVAAAVGRRLAKVRSGHGGGIEAAVGRRGARGRGAAAPALPDCGMIQKVVARLTLAKEQVAQTGVGRVPDLQPGESRRCVQAGYGAGDAPEELSCLSKELPSALFFADSKVAFCKLQVDRVLSFAALIQAKLELCALVRQQEVVHLADVLDGDNGGGGRDGGGEAGGAAGRRHRSFAIGQGVIKEGGRRGGGTWMGVQEGRERKGVQHARWQVRELGESY